MFMSTNLRLCLKFLRSQSYIKKTVCQLFSINIENRAENIAVFYGHNDCDEVFLLQFFFNRKVT